MAKARSSSAETAESEASQPSGISSSIPPAPPSENGAFYTGSHHLLFDPLGETQCDACGAALNVDEDAEGYSLGGQGVYMWTRGAEVRFEPAPLCASCASAIGMTALARWEIEEEEG